MRGVIHRTQSIALQQQQPTHQQQWHSLGDSWFAGTVLTHSHSCISHTTPATASILAFITLIIPDTFGCFTFRRTLIKTGFKQNTQIN